METEVLRRAFFYCDFNITVRKLKISLKRKRNNKRAPVWLKSEPSQKCIIIQNLIALVIMNPPDYRVPWTKPKNRHKSTAKRST